MRLYPLEVMAGTRSADVVAEKKEGRTTDGILEKENLK